MRGGEGYERGHAEGDQRRHGQRGDPATTTVCGHQVGSASVIGVTVQL
jgi:hypothetical protein